MREVENNPVMREKVRQRAGVLRLSHRGWDVQQIAGYTGRTYRQVLRDLDRWEARGLGGLADGTALGKASPIGEEQRLFSRDKLGEGAPGGYGVGRGGAAAVRHRC